MVLTNGIQIHGDQGYDVLAIDQLGTAVDDWLRDLGDDEEGED